MRLVAAFVCLSAVLAALLSTALSQVPIPSRGDAFVIGSGDAPVWLDMFGDLMCPDTSGAWPNIKQVVQYYGPSKLRFAFHVFALPYHRNSYWANQGMHVIAAANASAAWLWMEAVYANQPQFGNSATSAMTSPQIIDAMAQLAQQYTGVSAQQFTSGINDPNMDWATRVSWKYACSRYVSGTPTFHVNNVFIDADPSWTLSDWRQVLDPLVGSSAVHAAPPTPATFSPIMDCPTGQQNCTYLPGKSQCCLVGEICIPNVGCRC